MQHALRFASPITWNVGEDGALQEHDAPVVIMGINTLHLFQLRPEPTYERTLECRLFFTPPHFCAFGSYRALWDHGRTKAMRLGNGMIQAGIVVKTCTLPRRTNDCAGWSEPLLGSTIVPVEPEEAAIHTSLDEASGRFTLLLSKGHGDRRIAVVAVCDA
jgi:hypothetical protein